MKRNKVENKEENRGKEGRSGKEENLEEKLNKGE